MKKILVIDDQKSNLAKIKDILEKSIPACNVLTAQSGAEGIRIAKNEQPDTILLDVVLPEMDGYEDTRQIREFNKDVVIIAQTAYALYGDREKAIEAGCNDYISKPKKI